MERLHPFPILLYYVSVIGIAMFQRNPVVQGVSVIGTLVWAGLFWKGRSLRKGKKRGILRTVCFYILVFALITIGNPLFVHNGRTVLFYLRGNRVTLEAVWFGMVMGVMILSVLIWCTIMSRVLSSEHILFLVGRISMKAALVLSMVLRFVPEFHKQMEVTKENQRLLGLYKENTWLDKVRCSMLVFSGVVNWSFEHSMITSDSMAARYYGIGRRTHYNKYRMRAGDTMTVLWIIGCVTALLVLAGHGVTQTTYYPDFRMSGSTAGLFAFAGIYFLLIMSLPFQEVLGRVRYRRYRRDAER